MTTTTTDPALIERAIELNACEHHDAKKGVPCWATRAGTGGACLHRLVLSQAMTVPMAEGPERHTEQGGPR